MTAQRASILAPRPRASLVVCVVFTFATLIACGRTSGPAPASNAVPRTDGRTPASAPIPAAPSSTAKTTAQADVNLSATASSIRQATSVLAAYREAAGGPAVTAVRALEAIGISRSSSVPAPRILHIQAVYPNHYRQEETQAPSEGAPTRGSTTGRGPNGRLALPGAGRPVRPGPAISVAFGLNGEVGWLSGARLAGPADGKSRMKAETIAARQSLVDFMAGALPTWLLDSARFTFVDDGRVDAGADRGAPLMKIEGPDGHAGRLILDPTSHLPRRLIVDRRSHGGASDVGLTITYSDYSVVAGVQLPHTMIRATDSGVTTTWSIARWVVNGHIAPLTFAAPARGR